jgi:hypothetical protein
MHLIIKKYLFNNIYTSYSCNNMKNYIFFMKKFKKRNEKTKVKTLNVFFSLKMMCFFALKMAVTALAVNSVDLIISFL